MTHPTDGSCRGERGALRAIHGRPRPPSPHATRPRDVIWHDIECGTYTADLELWRELAKTSGGPILDLGCGTGRVALDLARQGHRVRGLDLDPELVGAFNERAAVGDLPAIATAADAREFDLGEEFAMVLAPMQFVQVLGGGSERLACLRSARRHLARSGSLAVAIVDGMPDELVEEAAQPLPDTRELDGWVYSSLPLDAGLDGGTIVVRRLRQTVSPTGELTDELDEIPLRLLAVETVEAEAVEAGFAPCGRREIPPTDSHVGSVVALLEAV
jgi:SAM-dependent methyltransferase